ncbi:MAG: AmmeMemoRadiSam system protein B [Gemmatimonadota bacterium]|nr:AmmeMemoRadiSam system protein B [Gemmatimonadota bacterium]MDH4347833.1 AmmeMemoRadiSam system protein B [Gemmatimonadota bacterium]MDH5284526.1 AmmeMemoRadiSam system protein B [Gemmatimonadota bacterium]
MTTTADLRPAAVAGQFYPDDPIELRHLVQAFLDPVPDERRRALAVMVPHAGLVYSGACAAQVFGRISWPEVAVILAPNHTGLGAIGRADMWNRGSFLTPLGEVPVAEDLAEELTAATPLVVSDWSAHRREHAIEVELPFLQVLSPQIRILPLVVSWDDWARSAELGRALARLAQAHPGRLLFVASSDMTHYESADAAKRQDQLALERIEQLDGGGLLGACHRNGISMCGRAPAAAVMEAARRLGAHRGTVVDYRHSGLVTGNDADVVSYAGVLFE